jgi:phenylacetate-CoA ligase
MNYVPKIEFASSEEIKSHQENLLRKLMRYVSEYSPFYKALFEKYAITASSISTLEDLRKIPPTTKDDLQKNNWEFLCIRRNQVAEYMATSGTLGKPVTIALSENDLERLAYNEAISFACAEGDATDLYQLMLTLDRQFMAGVAYYHGIRKLGAGLVRVGPGLPEMQWETIKRLCPTTIVGVPSFILKLIEYAEVHQIDRNSLSVKKAICIGENIRTPELTLNSLGKKISDKWDLKLFSTYASTEMQTAFTECKHGLGGHLHPELLIVELLDDDNQPVNPGEPGEVTITTLGVEAMPLFRYKTGDISVGRYEACPCGRTTMRLGPILGRKQQRLKVKGTTIYPQTIFDILSETASVTDFAVEAFTSSLGTDELRLHVVTGNNVEDIISNLQARFQSRLRLLPEINVVSSIELEKKINGITSSRKAIRFIDSRM